MHLAMVCSDDPVTSLDQVKLEGVPQEYASLMADDGQSYATFCPMLNLPQLPETSDELPRSEVPALLLNGGLDPATPFTGGEKVQAGLPNSYNIIVPAGTHIQGGSSPCILGIMGAFMRDPKAKPDTSCIDQSISFAVTGPVTVTSEDGSATLSLILGPEFARQGPGIWSNGELSLILAAFPASKSVDAVLSETAALLGIPSPEIVDGPTVAGSPSKMFQTETQGHAIDAIVFSNKQGTYRILLDIPRPDKAEAIRQTTLPALLETLSVSGE